MQELSILGNRLNLLPEKAIYLENLQTLLVSDVHLGKSETFQRLGVPISNQVNRATLDRLENLYQKTQPKTIVILGDLFHSKYALQAEVLGCWSHFLDGICAKVQLVIGNHDRNLVDSAKQLSIECFTDAIELGNLILSHEPCSQKNYLNICGHIHPCVRIKTKLDNLRLPCFYFDKVQNLLILPSFGEFTGGYEMPLNRQSTAYVVVEDAVIPFNA
jgi:uncharacterized protein